MRVSRFIAVFVAAGAIVGAAAPATRRAAGLLARGRFSVGNALLASAALMALAVPSAHAATTVVHPTGAYPADVENVQAAVNQGGTVALKATNQAGTPTAFNFGPPVAGSGFVRLAKDVELIGEQLGSAATTIQGGDEPIFSRSPITVALRGLRFEGPLLSSIALFVPPEADIEVVGNTVTGVVGRRFRAGGPTFADGITVRGGQARIADNVVEDIDAEVAVGISQFLAAGPVEIVGNRVSGTNTIAIESSENEGPVRIVDNVVRPGPERYPRGSHGTGIEVNGTGSFYVARNDATVENQRGTGIIAFGHAFFGRVTAAIIEKNDIALSGALSGIGLVGLVFDSYVGQNRLMGTGDIGLWLRTIRPGDEVAFNTLVGNNIARFDGTLADVRLEEGTHDNVVNGASGSVTDLGVNNHITGFTKEGRSGAGPDGHERAAQLAEAMEHRNEARSADR